MKPNYRKVRGFRAKHDGDFIYESIHSGYHRPIRTFNELRQNINDAVDPDCREVNCRPRARRNMSNLDSWNDFSRSRSGGKSWKDYTRHRKQWMVAADPKPSEPPAPRGWVAALFRFYESML